MDGQLLIIGFHKGDVKILSFEVFKIVSENAEEESSKPSHSKYKIGQQCLKELMTISGKTPVINIEFSSSGIFMAVSYDNAKS